MGTTKTRIAQATNQNHTRPRLHGYRGQDLPQAVVTKDHDVIRQWASRHQAEPATGEATASGPASTRVADGGTGLRFNFPGLSRFREITWEEWFAHFEQHNLVFVYEEEIADRAHKLADARGGEPGHDREDWFEAERQLGGPERKPMGRYHIRADA